MRLLLGFFLSFGLLTSPVFAQVATTDTAADTSSYIYGTDIKKPSMDNDCDDAMNTADHSGMGRDWQNAISLCTQSATAYRAILNNMVGEPPTAFDRVRFNEADTRWEVAYAYAQTDTPEKGEQYAQDAYKLFRATTDPYFAAIAPIMGWASGERKYVHFDTLSKTKQDEIHNALSDDQLHIGGGFLHLMQQVHQVYNDVCPEIDELTGQVNT